MKSQQEPPQPQPPPPHAAASTAAHGRTLENLKSLVLKCAIASSPSKSLSLEHTTLIEKRFQESVPSIHTPDHPTYQWMIENAIKKLKEDGGCCDEGGICRFILKEQKDLPWAHDTFLNHHLDRLSTNGTITKNYDGWYSIAPPKPSPGQRITRTTSLRPAASSSPTCASSDTSDSSWSSELKRRGTNKCNRGKRRQLHKQNARGSVTHPKLKRGGERACVPGHGRGRGRGSDYPCKEGVMEEACIGRVEGDLRLDAMPMVDIICLSTDDEETDQTEQVPHAQESQDRLNLAIREDQIVRVEGDACMDGTPTVEILCLLTDGEETDQRIQPLEQNMGDECFTRETIPSSRGSKKVRQQRKNIQSGQTRRGRGRPRKIETQDVNWVGQEDEDSMDALIDEVQYQLTTPTEIDGADVNLQRQGDMNQEDNGEPIDRAETRPRRTRNKSINVADGSKPSNARPARRRKKVSALV
ncbi:uncharacterized protein LOC121781725 [Salvia splendens]|uniref:uncharacterized protein LOC121781725 n=1 Tax=Salvia splendens TaxID=180675 RepID=UPI001C2768D3|nr:uncharacterized protein LOC121781725 [Salvia splendens]